MNNDFKLTGFADVGMSLQDIIDGMVKQAADQAPEDMKGKDDKDGKDGKDKPKDKDGKDGKDSKTPEDKDKDKDGKSGEQKKEASVNTGSTMAQEIMQKIASIKTNSEDSMNKTQAQEAGQLLADQLLEKLAAAGDTNTATGVTPGTVPNKAIVDSAAIVGEDNSKIQGLPGAGGTVNEIYDAVIADALAQGAASQDQVHTQGVAAVEGVPEQAATPNQVDTMSADDEQEKAAAVSQLVADGIDFDNAVNLVKQAAEDIAVEGQVKAAALGKLVSQGINFAEAVEMVKAASVAEPEVKTLEQEKRAAFDMLVQGGIDFETAAELVNAKAAQMYGK